MAYRIIKSEHNGAKNGGGARMERADAKKQSNRVRRVNEREQINGALHESTGD